MRSRKPFRTVPIKQGLAYRKKTAGQRRRLWFTAIGSAVTIGLGTGYLTAEGDGGKSNFASLVEALRSPSQEQTAARERSIYFAYCDQARAAGRTPISRGEPGYRPELDADGDGIACEPYP